MNYDEYKIKITDDIAVVTVDLLVATQRDAKPLWDELESKGILEWDKVIVDLSPCTFIDSTFIGMLVRIFKAISNKNGQMKLVFPEKSAKLFFHSTGITKIVNCYDALNDAVYSFNPKFPIRKISFGEEFHTN
jgi:anti-anti-sigma factor